MLLTAFASTYQFHFVIFTFFLLLDQACGLVESRLTLLSLLLSLSWRRQHAASTQVPGDWRPASPSQPRRGAHWGDTDQDQDGEGGEDGGVSVPVGCGVWWPGLPLTLTGVALVPAAASVEARDR